MGITTLFHTNNQWDTHRILHSGIGYGANFTLFADAYSHYIVGTHTSGLTLYEDQSYQVCRLILASGILAVAEFSGGGGVPYEVNGPSSPVSDAKIGHYLNNWNEEVGTAYIEMKTTSGLGKGNIYYYEGYPVFSLGWDATSGIGYFMNDVIGIDFPSSPRILVSTSEPYPESTGITVIEVHIVSGMANGIQVPSILNLPSGIVITDLEAQRYL
jgi:hypothetical protein